MKQRILASLLSAVLVLSMVPAAAAEEDPPAGGPEPVGCVCETRCTAEDFDPECPVCGAEGGYADCTAPAPQPQGDDLDGGEPVGNNPEDDLDGGEPAGDDPGDDPDAGGSAGHDLDDGGSQEPDGPYTAGTADELTQALEAIQELQPEEAVIQLTADLSDKEVSFAGVEGTHIILESQGEDVHSIRMASELVGGVTLDNVQISNAQSQNSKFTLYANGHTFETTENFSGKILTLYGGGPVGEDVQGGTELILRGAVTITYLYGGGHDSAVEGDVFILLEGEDLIIDNLRGGGHAQNTESGTVSGDVTIDMRQGKVKDIFGGGYNAYSTDDEEGDRAPASVGGTVTLNLGYEGAPAKSVWPGIAMYTYAGSYHSTVGNVVLNVTDGVTTENDAGDRNIFACGYNDTVRGTVQVHVSGAPDIGSGFLYGGGDCDIGRGEWPVRILNEEQEPYALSITYDVPSELEGAPTRHGINAGSKSSVPTEIMGDVRVELVSGNMDFLVLDNENSGNCTIHGDSQILIRAGRVAQVQGNKLEYQSEADDHTTSGTLTGGEGIEIGYFYYFDRVQLENDAEVLVDSEEFPVFGSTQKPFYSVSDLDIREGSYLTTRNSSTSIQNDVTMDHGTWHSQGETSIKNDVTMDHSTWHAKGYVYVYETMDSRDSQILWDNYYQIGYAHKDEADPSGTVRFRSKNDTFSAMYNTYLNKVYGDVEAENGTWSLLSRTSIVGDASFTGLTLQLPVVQTGENYPSKSIPLNIDGTASGTVSVVTIQADRPESGATMDATRWTAVRAMPVLGDNYITGFAPDGTAAGDTPPQSTFLLTNEDALKQGYYLKRVNDADADYSDDYFMWQVAAHDPSEQILWYYEVYYQSADGSFIRWKYGQGSWAYPEETVRISHEQFDDQELAWGGTLGTHYVFDETNPNNRLSAAAGAATSSDPLKIYYKAKPHTLTYQYEGEVPEGAQAPAQVQSWYSAEVTLAVPSLPGYTFSGWRVQSPSGLEIENGVLTMPDADVVLVGSWTEVGDPAVIIITAADMTSYTGGNSISGDPFPTARYQITAGEDVDLSAVTFTVNGQTQTLPENTKSGDIVLLPWLDENFTLDENASMGISAFRAGGEAENDAVAGEYVIGADLEGISAASGSGAPVTLDFRPGRLTVRYVSDPDGVLAVVDPVDLAQPVVTEASAVDTSDGIGIAVIPEGTSYYTNGKAELGLLGDNASDHPQIALLFDDILPGEAGEDTRQLLIDRAEAAGFTLTGKKSQFKYLDLINENDGNAWVSTSDGSTITIYWPCPENMPEDNITVQVLHFRGLHREYRGDLENQVINAEVEELPARVENGNIVFTLEGDQTAGSFSPFAVFWTDDEDDEDDRDDDDDDRGHGGSGSTPQLNKEDHFAYVSGYPDGTVQPNDPVTREEVATIFFRLLTDASRADYITERNPFPDVESDRWSFWSITTLNNGGIMTGRTSGSFDPGAYITRAEFAVVAAQFSNARYSGPDKFSDISDHWAREYINRAAAEGWIAGYPDGTYGPERSITRAEVMALINEVLDRAPDADHMLDDMIHWPDNPESAWYYEDVQEATNCHTYRWSGSLERWIEITDMRTYADLVRDALRNAR